MTDGRYQEANQGVTIHVNLLLMLLPHKTVY
jgi:hypothetical protein